MTSVGLDIICGYKVLRELGSRALPSYAAIDPRPRRPEDALCVIERLPRDPEVNAEAAAEFMRDAKRLSQVRHPNLVRVRDVVLGTNTVLLVTDWVDGEVYSDIARMAAEQGIPIPLAGSLRVVVDLLEGLSALHEVCDAKREPLRIVHAEVAPRNIVVGADGRSVLVHPLHAPAGLLRKHAPEVVGYLAPEVLLGDQTADQRADVYGAGVLLWEALMGRRMHADGEDPGEIVMRLLGGRIDAACAPVDAPWAAPLAEAAKKAVSPDPTVRFANATEMLASVRRVVGARLAPKLTVSALVEAVAGARIRERNTALGAARTARLPSDSAWTTEARDPPASTTASTEPTAAKPPETTASAALDPEATKPPPSVPPPTSSRPRVAPSWGKIRVPTATTERAAPSSDPNATPVGPASSAPAAPPRPSESPPSSADVVEVIEMEVPPDRPSRPRAPPPVPKQQRRPPPPVPAIDFTESKTDMAALVSPAPAVHAKARWTIGAACIVAAGAVLWMLVRPSASTRADIPAEGPSASATTSQAKEPPVPSPAPSSTGPVVVVPSPPPSASAAVRAPSDSSPFEPSEAPTARAAAPERPATPVVRAPAPSPPPAAASSTRGKKAAYDPMGI